MKKELGLRFAYLVIPMVCFIASSALAQGYPDKPIHLIVPSSPGGTTGTSALLFQSKLSESLGQPVVLDYRPGANSIIGTDLTAKAKPDGYTILITSNAHTISAAGQTLPYDPIKDFAPVILTTRFPLVLVVNPSVPAKSVKELIELAKSKPGQLNYGSGGIGTPSHVGAELFMQMAGIRMVHLPYKGGGAVFASALSGEIQVVFNTLSSSLPHIQAGSLRALAVSSSKRSSELPNLPTIAESFPGFEVIVWNGVLAPGGTPKQIVTRLNTEISKIMQMPELRKKLLELGGEFTVNTPEEFGDLIRADIAKWSKLIKDRGIVIQ